MHTYAQLTVGYLYHFNFNSSVVGRHIVSPFYKYNSYLLFWSSDKFPLHFLYCLVVHRSTHIGQHTLVNTHWSTHIGQHTLINIQWSTYIGQHTMVTQWSIHIDQYTLVNTWNRCFGISRKSWRNDLCQMLLAAGSNLKSLVTVFSVSIELMIIYHQISFSRINFM